MFLPNTTYIVTAGTYRKSKLFDTAEKRDFLLGSLFEESGRWKWELQAWAVMENHYHFVANACDKVESLRQMMRSLHSKTAIWLNKKDGVSGRKIWFQY